MLRRLLAYDETRNLNLDDPTTTELRREILRKNGFLTQIYSAWYREILAELPAVPGQVVEIGSGAGFLKSVLPQTLTSELLEISGMDLAVSALALPFANGSLKAIAMTNVLHHIPKVEQFFEEALRSLAPGGRVILIEPWLTDWSRFIYSHLHHEPMDPDAPEWDFASEGPLSGANEALAWMVFERDRPRFEARFPGLRLRRLEAIMPFAYLLSGGFTSRLHLPGGSFGLWSAVEKALARWNNRLAMFAVIVLEKV